MMVTEGGLFWKYQTAQIKVTSIIQKKEMGVKIRVVVWFLNKL
jgi:hypothetical protein